MTRASRRGQESLRRDIAYSPPRRVEEEVEVFRVVAGHESRLEGREVGEENPVPRRHQHVFALYVAVTHLSEKGAEEENDNDSVTYNPRYSHSIAAYHCNRLVKPQSFRTQIRIHIGYILVTYSGLVTLIEGAKKLECDPFFLNRNEKRSRRNPIV